MKKAKNYLIKTIFLNLGIVAFLLTFVLVKTQDIVQSDDIGGSSTVFQLPRKNRSNTARTFSPKNSVKKSESQKASFKRATREQIAAVVPKRRRDVVKNPGELVAKIKDATKRTPGLTPQQIKANNIKIYLSLGDTYLENRNYEQAAAAYSSALLESSGKSKEAEIGLSEALVGKADSFADQNYLANAMDGYNQAIKYNPKNAAAYAGLGSAYEELEKYDEALTNYQKAVEINDKLSEIYEPLGSLYLRKNDLKNADLYLSKAYDAGKRTPQTAQSIGIIRYNQNRLDEALAALKNLDTAEANFYLGEIAQRRGDKEEALKYYATAIKMNNRYFDALNELGSLYLEKGDIENAIKNFEEAVKSDNTSAEANENLADAYRLRGQKSTDAAERKRSYQQAENYYNLAILHAERIKTKTGVYDEQILARLYSKMGFIKGRFEKWEEAIAFLEKSKQTNTQIKKIDTEYQSYVDNSNLGWAYYNSAIQDDRTAKARNSALSPAERTALQTKARGKLSKAKDVLNLALSENQNSIGTLMNLGTTLNDLGEYQAAVAILDKCLNLRPDWLIALNEIGTSYYALNMLDRAAESFRKAIKGNGNFFVAVRNLAATEFKRGNKSEVKRLQDILRVNRQNALLNELDVMIKLGSLNNPALKLEDKVKSKVPKIPGSPY